METNDLRKAAEMALEALEMFCEHGAILRPLETKEALRQALAQDALRKLAEIDHELGLYDDGPAVKSYCGGKPNYCTPEQEPVTLLPDGSAFGVMSFPLPESHWLYAEREYHDGEHEPIELGKPILTHELRDAVVSAVRYAIRGATNCGKEMDFDPDALVQNAVYALCGPYTRFVDAVNMSQECVDETAKGEHEPVAWANSSDLQNFDMRVRTNRDHYHTVPLYTATPKREWVGLTRREFEECVDGLEDLEDCWVAIEAKLKEKNT